MARRTKLVINTDDFYELEVFGNDKGEIGISIGVHEIAIIGSRKRDEHVMSLNNNQIDSLIEALIDLRYQ